MADPGFICLVIQRYLNWGSTLCLNMCDILDNTAMPAKSADRHKTHTGIISKEIAKCAKCYQDINNGMKGETALYWVVREGFWRRQCSSWEWGMRKSQPMWRLEGKGSRQKEACKLMSETKDDSGLFEILKEGLSTEMGDQCLSRKIPRVKALVEISL